MPKRSRKTEHPNQLHMEVVIRAAARRRELAAKGGSAGQVGGGRGSGGRPGASESDAGQAGAGYREIATELRDAIRAALAKAKAESSLSRDNVAKRMSELLGTPISESQIAAWTAESKAGQRGRHIPAEYLPALCEACGCDGPLDVLCAARGKVRREVVAEISVAIAERREREAEIRRERREYERLLASAQKLAVVES